MSRALYEKVSTDQSNLQHPYMLGLAHTVAETANQIKVTLRRKWTKSMMFKIITVNGDYCILQNGNGLNQ